MAATKGALPHEVFVGNTHRGQERLRFFAGKGLKTIRLGEQALDIEGNPLPPEYAPIFIDRRESDHHNAIMMEATFGPHWRRG